MITLDSVSKKYDDKTILHNVSFNVSDKEILCILGESGSGKTTILNIIAGLLSFEGKMQNDFSRISYVFQNPLLISTLTVEGNLKYTGSVPEMILPTLKKLGIDECSKKYPGQLSGGEKQRVSIARAVLNDPDLILLDEPLSSIDYSRKLELIKYLSDFIRGEKKRSAIYVTHDIEEALMIADRIVILKEGTVKSEYNNCLDAFPGAYGAPNSLRQKIISEISE